MTQVTQDASPLPSPTAREEALRSLLRRCFPHVCARADDGAPGAEGLAAILDAALRIVGHSDDDMLAPSVDLDPAAIERAPAADEPMVLALAAEVQRLWRERLLLHEQLLSVDAAERDLVAWLRASGVPADEPDARPAPQASQWVEHASRLLETAGRAPSAADDEHERNGQTG